MLLLLIVYVYLPHKTEVLEVGILVTPVCVPSVQPGTCHRESGPKCVWYCQLSFLCWLIHLLLPLPQLGPQSHGFCPFLCVPSPPPPLPIRILQWVIPSVISPWIDDSGPLMHWATWLIHQLNGCRKHHLLLQANGTLENGMCNQ